MVIFVPLLCPGHNKPITRADGEGWLMRAPSPSGEWDWEGQMMCVCWSRPGCFGPGTATYHLGPRRRCCAAAAAAALVVSGLEAAVCLMMNQICRALAELGPLSAPMIVWCISFLARAWLTLLAFQEKKKKRELTNDSQVQAAHGNWLFISGGSRRILA